MSNDKIVKVWKSGSVRGYNGDGIKISATYRLKPEETRASLVDIRFYDNSLQASGPISRLRSFSVDNAAWTDVPLPDPEGVIGEGVNTGFTIRGQIRLEERAAGPFLRVRLNWGEDQVHAEEGYVMALDSDERAAG